MSHAYETATIVGVGLLGGSLGLALKKRGIAKTVRGVGHRQETLDRARAIGAVDEISMDVVEASMGAELIVICTPAALVPGYLDDIRPVCGVSTVVTDVASTKSVICAGIRKNWSAPFRFIGSHPMAGSEKYGPEHADATLYENSICFVEAIDNHAEDAHAAVVSLWQDLGAEVVTVDPLEHDALVARTSHVPHIAASALAQLVRAKPSIAPYLGKGFRDATRIAEGRPEIWRDICLTNKEAIGEGLKEMRGMIDAFAQAVEQGDAETLERFFKEGVDARREALEE